MTPQNVAGFSIPQAQLQELLDALAALEDDNVVPLRPAAADAKAA